MELLVRLLLIQVTCILTPTSPNPQMMIDSSNHWCSGGYSATDTTGTYYNSGTSTYYSLQVGSNKTLLGQGSSAGMYVYNSFI